MDLPGEQAPTLYGLAALLTTQLIKWAQQSRRDKRRHSFVSRQLESLGKLVEEVKDDCSDVTMEVQKLRLMVTSLAVGKLTIQPPAGSNGRSGEHDTE